MHKIRALKDKYAAEAPSHEELSQLIANRFIQLENNAKEWEQRYQALSTNIPELQAQAAELENLLDLARQRKNSKEQELLISNARLKELEVEKNAAIQEAGRQRVQRDHLKNKKPSHKDLQIIEHGKKKFQYYKQLTGIRWDFSAEGAVKGYVTNGSDYIHTFNYDEKDKSSNVPELLWKEIGIAVGCASVDETYSKENNQNVP